MKVLRHHDIPRNNELIFHSDFFEDLQEKIFAARRFQKLSSVITAAGDEMEFTTTMKSPQSFGHGNNIVQASIIPTLRSTNEVPPTPASKSGLP